MDFPISVPSVGLVDGRFVDEDPLLGRPGSLIPSAWGNSITLEVLNVIEAAGLDPSEADLTQLLQAIRLIAQSDSGTFGNDTGAANVYTVAYSPAIPALANGLTLRFKAKTANTSASTFSPNGLMAKPLVGLGASALQGGEIVANSLCTVVYSATSDQWVLVESTGGALQVGPATKSQHALQLGQAVGRRINTQILTSSGTYTRSSGVSFIIVRAVGGGGAGGGSAATSAGQCAAGGGGASGAYAEGIFASPPATVAVTVGSAGVPMNGNAPGGNGGSTVFGALMTCPGGPGGLGAPATATGGASISGANSGNSLSPTGGNIIGVAGQAGENGLALNTSAAGSGGSSPLGAGGNSPVAVGGRPASGYGAGGSGSNSPSNTPASQAGGAGTPGIVIVEEYA